MNHSDQTQSGSMQHLVKSGQTVRCTDVIVGPDERKYVQIQNGKYVPLFTLQNEPLFEWIRDGASPRTAVVASVELVQASRENTILGLRTLKPDMQMAARFSPQYFHDSM